MDRTDVLVVGAGPTGLALALWLQRLGVRVRVVDKAPEPGKTSRALAVQARTLELYRQMGLADPVVRRGLPMKAANLWIDGRRRAHIGIGEMGTGLSPFPYVLIYPQDEHEQLLVDRLASAGVRVERPVELVALEDHGSGVKATLRDAGGATEVCEARYLAGCDGARSFVRDALQVGFPGGTYEHVFYVADVEASGAALNGELHVAFDPQADFVVLFPLDGATHVRLIGTVVVPEDKREAFTWDDVAKRVIERMPLQVARVHWFSTYRVHHRVAGRFRVGRSFLLGDAAHIHSPLGGQGMNTGLGDAINLAWKLAATIDDRAPPSILDSYEKERVPFARRLVHTTDRAFELVSSTSAVARQTRVHLAPRVVSLAFRSRVVRRFLFDTVSQIRITYRHAGWSEGRVGSVHGGDRLPWVCLDDGRDNFAPLSSVDWQAHVYGVAPRAVEDACSGRGIPLHVFPFGSEASRAGFVRDAFVLVRPDGYVALAAPSSAAARALPRYLDAHGLRPSGGSTTARRAAAAMGKEAQEAR